MQDVLAKQRLIIRFWPLDVNKLREKGIGPGKTALLLAGWRWRRHWLLREPAIEVWTSPQ